MKYLIIITALFVATACKNLSKEILYELRPDEKIVFSEEHQLAIYSGGSSHYLFTSRGDNQLHFILDGKEEFVFDSLFRFNFPDIILFKDGKRYRFDPYRKKMNGPFDYLDGMGLDLVQKGDHLAFVGIKDSTASMIFDGEVIKRDTVNGFNNGSVYSRLIIGDDGEWGYLVGGENDPGIERKDKSVTKFKKNLVLPEWKSGFVEVASGQIRPDRLVFSEKKGNKTMFFLNEKFLFDTLARFGFKANTNFNNTAIEWGISKAVSENDQIKWIDKNFIWVNGNSYGPFENAKEFDNGFKVILGDEANKFAMLVNPDRRLLSNGKLQDEKNVAIFSFNKKTGSTLAVTDSLELFFNGTKVGKFNFDVDGGIIYTKTGFMNDTDNYFFVIRKDSARYYHLSNGQEVSEDKNPIFSNDPDTFGYLEKSKVIIGGKEVGEGFSLVFDPAKNVFKWLSLDGNKVLVNSYKP